MPKRKEGVYEKLLDSAKKEFLLKGFRDASLRVIASEADTSTSSIYTRFKDKQGLFDAIIQPIADEYIKMFTKIQEQFWQMESYDDYDYMLEYSEKGQKMLLDYIYEHFDEFQLLLCQADEVQKDRFMNTLIDIETKGSLEYLDVMQPKQRVDEEFMHIINTAFFNGFFEIVHHKMDKEKAYQYITRLRAFYNAGYATVYDAEF